MNAPRRKPEEIIATHARPDWSDERAERVRLAIEARVSSKTPRRVRQPALGWALAAAASLLIAVGVGSLAFRNLRGVEEATQLDLADGSYVTPTSPGTRFEVSKMTDTDVLIVLERGDVTVDVAKNPERTFRVRAGEVEVTVLGTRFTVSRAENKTSVQVEHGRVRVAAPRESVELRAGGQASFDEDKLLRIEEAPPAEPEPEPKPKPKAQKRPVRKARPHAKKASDWQDLARRGAFSEAALSLEANTASDLNGVEELMLAGDVYRLSGRGRKAIRVLTQVFEKYPTDPRAPLARFTVGRIMLADLGQPKAAARAFRAVRINNPNLGLAEDALAREVEAWSRAGDLASAREAALLYLEKYPQGHRAAWVRSYAGLE